MSSIAKTENKILMSQARDALSERWGFVVGTMFVYNIFIILFCALLMLGFSFFIIFGPMSVGLCIFSLSISRKQDSKLSQIFNGFNKFGVSLGAYLLQTILIFLWSLLLIIPGIIAALSYSMTFFIIAENESIGPLEAITKSKEMMDGNKWKFFCLGLRFLGWYLLCILTLGIGFLWLMPYMAVSYAKFYDDISQN